MSYVAALMARIWDPARPPNAPYAPATPPPAPEAHPAPPGPVTAPCGCIRGLHCADHATADDPIRGHADAIRDGWPDGEAVLLAQLADLTAVVGPAEAARIMEWST